MKPDAMRAHIAEIAERHQIAIEWSSGRRAWAAREMDLVHIPPITSEVTYAIALHEFGHHLGRHQHSRSVIARERWAWQWAREQARCWTQTMERRATRDLNWYTRQDAKQERPQ
jgi:hypothetical protein